VRVFITYNEIWAVGRLDANGAKGTRDIWATEVQMICGKLGSQDELSTSEHLHFFRTSSLAIKNAVTFNLEGYPTAVATITTSLPYKRTLYTFPNFDPIHSTTLLLQLLDTS
jgi:hypothetical protein